MPKAWSTNLCEVKLNCIIFCQRKDSRLTLGDRNFRTNWPISSKYSVIPIQSPRVIWNRASLIRYSYFRLKYSSFQISRARCMHEHSFANVFVQSINWKQSICFGSKYTTSFSYLLFARVYNFRTWRFLNGVRSSSIRWLHVDFRFIRFDCQMTTRNPMITSEATLRDAHARSTRGKANRRAQKMGVVPDFYTVKLED